MTAISCNVEASPAAAEVLASKIVASSGLLGLLSSVNVAATQASLKSGSPGSGHSTQQSAASAVRPFLISSIMGLREPPNGKCTTNIYVIKDFQSFVIQVVPRKMRE